jgi:hypothetical protein
MQLGASLDEFGDSQPMPVTTTRTGLRGPTHTTRHRHPPHTAQHNHTLRDSSAFHPACIPCSFDGCTASSPSSLRSRPCRHLASDEERRAENVNRIHHPERGGPWDARGEFCPGGHPGARRRCTQRAANYNLRPCMVSCCHSEQRNHGSREQQPKCGQWCTQMHSPANGSKCTHERMRRWHARIRKRRACRSLLPDQSLESCCAERCNDGSYHDVWADQIAPRDDGGRLGGDDKPLCGCIQGKHRRRHVLRLCLISNRRLRRCGKACGAGCSYQRWSRRADSRRDGHEGRRG